ncbi:MAG: hypothetical protein HOH58_01625 [Opitutaceae bacterium]|jgi:hypothetical protein|nr:hypothetical protein [Opitutaceae bacterium]
MNSKLTYIALFSAISLAGVALAETAGLPVTSAAAYALPFGAFIVSLVLMTFTSDYGRPLLVLTTDSRAALLPADEVFSATNVISRRPAIAARRRVGHSLAATR